MPFKSKAQQRLMFAKAERGEIPKKKVMEWAHKTKSIKTLPEYVEKKSALQQAFDIGYSKALSDAGVEKQAGLGNVGWDVIEHFAPTLAGGALGAYMSPVGYGPLGFMLGAAGGHFGAKGGTRLGEKALGSLKPEQAERLLKEISKPTVERASSLGGRLGGAYLGGKLTQWLGDRRQQQMGMAPQGSGYGFEPSVASML